MSMSILSNNRIHMGHEKNNRASLLQFLPNSTSCYRSLQKNANNTDND